MTSPKKYLIRNYDLFLLIRSSIKKKYFTFFQMSNNILRINHIFQSKQQMSNDKGLDAL